MESKAVPSWANQEEIAGRPASTGKARSMGRDEWNQRYAVSEYRWTVDASRFLIAEAASLRPGRALLVEKAHAVERIVGTDDSPRVAIDCFVRDRRLS